MYRNYVHYSVDVVRGRLYENYLTRKFITQNIYNMKISQTTVYHYGGLDQVMCLP